MSIKCKSCIHFNNCNKDNKLKNYWNNKWLKNDIVFYGRKLKNHPSNLIPNNQYIAFQAAVDVKSFIFDNDAIMKYIISKYNLKKSSNDDTILSIQQFICDGHMQDFFADFDFTVSPLSNSFRNRPTKTLTYASDIKYQTLDYWLFPFETAATGYGDCEDGAIWIASLAINAGVPNWRVKIAIGNVSNRSDYPLAPSFDDVPLGQWNNRPPHPTIPNWRLSEGGHTYCIYLASDDEWRVIDWCYFPDQNISTLNKLLAKNNKRYLDPIFTFNNEFSWAQQSFCISGKLDEVDSVEEIIK